MRPDPLLFSLLLTIALFGSPALMAQEQDAGSKSKTDRPFLVFDGINYGNKPDLTTNGLRPIHIIYQASYWARGESLETARENPVRTAAHKAGRTGMLTCIDIEHWPTRAEFDDETVAQSIDRYLQVIRWTRDARPGLRLGIYATIPARDYWSVYGGEEKMQQWREGNDRLAPLAREVDVIFPSLYTFYENQDGWEGYARANLAEAKRYGKPVYAFLWPQYHNSNKELEGQLIEADFWRRQLEVCYEEADGVVIWTGRNKTWDPQAGWWRATLDFMESLNAPGE